MCKISIVTDEVSSDLETALEIITSWGIDSVELRGIGTMRVPDLDPYWTKRLRTLIDRFKVRVVAISPGLFKISYFENETRPDQQILRWEDKHASEILFLRNEVVNYHFNTLLANSLKMAKEFGTDKIIIFSFDRPPGNNERTPDQIIDLLREAAKKATAENIILCLEVEHICWGNTGEMAKDIVSRVNHPNFRINWDPANALKAEDIPFPDGYTEISDYVEHVHFKDAAISEETGKMEWSIMGDVDWKGQIQALVSNGYEGYISVESHCIPKIKSAKYSLDRIRSILETGNDLE